MKLRVWHIPNVPGTPFTQIVASIAEAKQVLRTLARYDLYLDGLIDSNAQGLEAFVDDEWGEWHHPHTGMTIDEYEDDLEWEPVEPRREGAISTGEAMRVVIREVVEACEPGAKPYHYVVDMQLISKLEEFLDE